MYFYGINIVINRMIKVIIIKRLNIFIDESGDFGFMNGSSDLYAVSFTLHESANTITNELRYLNEKLNKLRYDGMIHLAYLVAKEEIIHTFLLKNEKAFFGPYSIFLSE